MSNTTSPYSTISRTTLVPKALREPPPPYFPPEQHDENTPLLIPSSPRRARRDTMSGRSDRLSISHTQPAPGQEASRPASPVSLTTSIAVSSLTHRTHGYFQPLFQWEYYRPVIHLGVINFPLALVAWVYLFVGTLVGTTLLLTLPFGVLIWWATLLGAKMFTRWELKLQSKFHYGRTTPTNASLSQILTSSTDLEAGTSEVPPAYEQSFLQETYAMFLDPTSYQPLFYFIVIKSATTLLITPLVIAIVPVSLVLVFPAPWILRKVKRVGIWQADLAFEGLRPFNSP